MIHRTMKPAFTIVRRVEFSETDMAGIMHFSNFFRFMESAEHAFFRSLGLSVAHPDTEGKLGLPRIHAQCEFKSPLRFEDEVEVQLFIEKISRKTICYRFALNRINPGPPKESATGAITVICVEKSSDGSLKAVPLPKNIESLLKEKSCITPTSESIT